MITDTKLQFWIENNLNVLIEGSHGVGKTTIIGKAFEDAGLTWQYFSASTMDPWVDFIGVPKEKITDDGISFLDLIRPMQFQDGSVDAIFFDEFNRSPSKVRNAVLELVQFKSINGRPIPGLRMVWAAINPDDEESDIQYDVEELDPAQLDRFHIHTSIPNEPNREYFAGKFGDRTGLRAIEWWHSLPDGVKTYVSPRRLDSALEIFALGGDLRDVLHKNTRPLTLKQKLERVSLSTSHSERWLKDPTVYIKEVADRNSTIDVVAAFTELKDVSMDQAVAFIDKLPANKLNLLATKNETVGILLRAVKLNSISRKLHTALTNKSHNKDTMVKACKARIAHLRTHDTKLYEAIMAAETAERERANEGEMSFMWNKIYSIVVKRITNEVIEYDDCVLLLMLSGECFNIPEAKQTILSLIEYVETMHSNNLLDFVQSHPHPIVAAFE